MATNKKISELDYANMPISDANLVAVVQSDQYGTMSTKRVSVGDFKSSMLSGVSTNKLLYLGGNTAIEATASQINVYNSANATVATISSSNLTLSHAQASLQLKTYKRSSSNYDSELDLTGDGFRFTRLETDPSNGSSLRASQIRLNSADGYFNAKENVKIAAGTLDNNNVTYDGLNSGTLYLMAGKDVNVQAKQKINLTSGTSLNISAATDVEVVATNIDFTASKEFTVTNSDAGIQLETTGSSTQNGVTTNYINVATVKKDGIKLTTEKDGTIVNQLQFSNSTAVITSPNLTIISDSFSVKSSSSAVLFDSGSMSYLKDLQTNLTCNSTTQSIKANNLTFVSTPAATMAASDLIYVKSGGILKTVDKAGLKAFLGIS